MYEIINILYVYILYVLYSVINNHFISADIHPTKDPLKSPKVYSFMYLKCLYKVVQKLETDWKVVAVSLSFS